VNNQPYKPLFSGKSDERVYRIKVIGHKSIRPKKYDTSLIFASHEKRFSLVLPVNGTTRARNIGAACLRRLPTSHQQWVGIGDRPASASFPDRSFHIFPEKMM
jgi:hypothetical protein